MNTKFILTSLVLIVSCNHEVTLSQDVVLSKNMFTMRNVITGKTFNSWRICDSNYDKSLTDAQRNNIDFKEQIVSFIGHVENVKKDGFNKSFKIHIGSPDGIGTGRTLIANNFSKNDAYLLDKGDPVIIKGKVVKCLSIRIIILETMSVSKIKWK